MSGALTPPRLPATLAGRSAFILKREPDERWFLWNFVWGVYNGAEPMFVGYSRADAQRALQAIDTARPIYIEP